MKSLDPALDGSRQGMEDPPATAAAARFSTQSTVAPSTSLSAHELIKEKQAGDLPAPPEDALASRDGQSPAEDEKEHDFREKGLATHEAEKAQDPYNSTVPEQHKSEEETVGEGEDESKYLSGAPLLVLVISLCLVTFLIGLDQMVIATAIPKITTEFHSLSQVGWYGSAYLLTTTSLQPNFGKVYTYFNVKYTFIAAMVIFERMSHRFGTSCATCLRIDRYLAVGSVCCAVAQGSVTLIVGRAIAGSGAAGLFSGGSRSTPSSTLGRNMLRSHTDRRNSDNCRVLGASAEACNLHCRPIQHVWPIVNRRSNLRRCLYRQINLAVVLLG